MSPVTVCPMLMRWILAQRRTLVVQPPLLRQHIGCMDRCIIDWPQVGEDAAVIVSSRQLRLYLEAQAVHRVAEGLHPHVTHILDISGAFLPGLAAPHVMVLVERRGHRTPVRPVRPTVRVMAGIRGEPSQPNTPEEGQVWRAFCGFWDTIGGNEWVRTVDAPRTPEGLLAARAVWPENDGSVP